MIEARTEVAGMPIETGQEWLAWLPLAARLAALGQDQLGRMPDVARPFPVQELLVERAMEGVWELRQALGEDLGLAVVAAQDFHCLRLLAPERAIPERAALSLEAWGEEAENTSLDPGAVLFLEQFIERFPLPEHLRLAVVDSPLPELVVDLLSMR